MRTYLISGCKKIGKVLLLVLLLEVVFVSKSVYAADQGSDKNTAQEISTNQWITASFDSDDDVDCFKFTARKSGTHQITVKPTTVAKMYQSFKSYRTDAELDDGTYFSGEVLSYTVSLTQGEVYYIRNSSEGTGGYSFYVNDTKVSSISLNYKSITMEPYDEITLVPTFNPSNAFNRNVMYKSSNGHVAGVGQYGDVTACDPGRATITCYLEDNPSVYATLVVDVLPEAISDFSSDDDLCKATSLGLSWEFDESDIIDGYTIYQYDATKKNWKTIANLSRSKEFYTVKGLKPGITYKFAISSYVKSGSTKIYSKKKELSESTLPDKTKITKIKRKGSNAELAWKNVTGASGYYIFASTSKNGRYYLVGTKKDNKTQKMTIKKLPKNGALYFKIIAYKKFNGYYYNGSYSSVYKA